MADPLRTLLGGFVETIPQDTPPTLRLGFIFWRVTIVVLTVLCIAGGIAVESTGEAIIETGESLMEDPLLILLTLGFILLIGLLFLALGSIFVVLGATLFLFAPVLFFLLTWILGRVLRGESTGAAAAGWSMGAAIVLGLFLGTLPGAIVADLVGMPALTVPFTFVAVIAPVIGLFLILQRESRDWLKGRAVAQRA